VHSLEELRSLLVETFSAHIPPGPVALIGFPSYDNVGDSAIWLGEVALLESLGHKIRYVADDLTYHEKALRSAMPGGTVLLTGGGNLGDLWSSHQDLRLAALQQLPDYPVIQLPQTSHFRTEGAFNLARQVFTAHPSFHVLCRDRQTLVEIGELNNGRASLCPDAAFGLQLAGPDVDRRGIVRLARTDAEASFSMAGVDSVDWVSQLPGSPGYDATYAHALRAYSGLCRRVRLLSERLNGRVRAPQWLLSRAFDWLARRRLGTGVAMLGGASAVVTDRLHAHILCLLLNVPHVVVDSGYGKITSFYDQWTRGIGKAQLAGSKDEAEKLVCRLKNYGREA
jgi:exopolysaccharide biosynthesis predicted pyruvyltransferase EpsI